MTGSVDWPDALSPRPGTEPYDYDAARRLSREAGFVCFRHLLPVSLVSGAAESAARILSAMGYVGAMDDHGRLPVLRCPEEDFYGSGIDRDAYVRLQRCEEIHALTHAPALREALAAIIDKPLLQHPNFIIRAVFPGGFATPPHQDLIHTRGSENAWTCWIPMMDCPRSMGPLTILSRSHGALLPTKPRANGGMEAILSGGEEHWVSGDLSRGDCLIFHGRTVHKALPNVSGSFLRLSVDCRYQPLAEPIQPVSLLPHGTLQDWEAIYADWSDRSRCYEWQKEPLNLAGSIGD